MKSNQNPTTNKSEVTPNVGDVSIQIRFTKVEDSLWYSLSDVIDYLISKEAISNTRNIKFLIRKSIANANVKSQCHLSINQYLSIKPFDIFINWTKFGLIYQHCLKSEFKKIKKTQILEAIDLDNPILIKKHYPEIFKMFQKVEFIER